METEQALRRRIETVADLHAIVRTMKALAAVSIRQYESTLHTLDSYTRTLEMGFQVLMRGRVMPQPSGKNPPVRLGAIIFGSDVGLCGRFNEDVVTFSLDQIKGVSLTPQTLNLLAVGNRIESRLGELNHPVSEMLPTPGSAAGIGTTVKRMQGIIEQWQDQAFESVWLFYMQQETPVQLQLLPIDFRQFGALARRVWPSKVLPCFSMDADRLLAALVRQHLFISLYRACAASLASENQMRLRAMQAAEQNIQDKHTELTLAFRNQHQDAIDAELLDICTGFEAVSTQTTQRLPAHPSHRRLDQVAHAEILLTTLA